MFYSGKTLLNSRVFATFPAVATPSALSLVTLRIQLIKKFGDVALRGVDLFAGIDLSLNLL